MRLIQTDKYRQ